MLEPSAQIDALLNGATVQPGNAGIQAMLEREPEFPNRLAAQLAGIAADPTARALADQYLDTSWADEERRQRLLQSSGSDREVIIGSGCHAAVYAAVRVLSGYPRPLVLERGRRAGGTFAMTGRPTFYLNSRNRAGIAGLAGDLGASLNFLPGAPVQAANFSMAEYQTNADLAFVIRLALAQYADVVTEADVRAVAGDGNGLEIGMQGRSPLFAQRVIDARGLGDPVDAGLANGTTVVTFPQFMQRMAGPWPLRGVRRAAVIGGGDAGKCTVESLLGIAPAPQLAAAALDWVERIDWYADSLPATCDDWRDDIRGRYQAIGPYLRSDRYGVQRVFVQDRRATPIAVPGAALIEGRGYDLVVLCTGSAETLIDGIGPGAFDLYTAADGAPVARKAYGLPVFRVGPHARLPITVREEQNGVGDIDANAVSIFRLAAKTAALAATLPSAAREADRLA
ncbi:hypothetical protein ACQP00_21860 [Dactylosporangium sp. CS-047395]|uniref:hypothetical protein n=1 Tax=Dactylosporangium sp. CS-047395 TaxID=3239936 RepID=UPI003D92269A